MFGGNEQVVKRFRIAKGRNIAFTVARVNVGVLIRCITGVVGESMVSNVQGTVQTSRIKRRGVVLIHAVNPLPDVAPQVFFSTVGNNLDAVCIDHNTGIIAQRNGCTGVFGHVGFTVIRFGNGTIADCTLNVKAAILNQHKHLTASHGCGILLLPTGTTLLGQLAHVCTGCILGQAGKGLCVCNAAQGISSKICNLCVIQNVCSGRSIIQGAFKGRQVNVIVGVAVFDEGRMQLETGFRFVTNIIAGLAKMVAVVFALGDNIHIKGHHLIIKAGLLHHDLNFGSSSIGARIGAAFDGDTLGQGTGGGKCCITVICNHFAGIGDVAPSAPTKAVNTIKGMTTRFAVCTGQTGETLVFEIDFHTIDVGIGITHECLKIRNLVLKGLNVANGGNCCRVNGQRHIVGIADGGYKLDVCARNHQPVICGHIAVAGSFDGDSIQDFSIIRVFCIQTQCPHIVAGLQLCIAEGRFHLDCNIVGAGDSCGLTGLLDVGKCGQTFQLGDGVGGGRSGNLGELHIVGSCDHLCQKFLAVLGDNQFGKFSHCYSILSIFV